MNGLAQLTPGAPFEGVFAVREVERRLSRAGKPFLSVVLADATGSARGAATARVIYGGSVNGTSADPLLATDGVDGLFVGRAALDPTQFAAIVEAGQRRATGPRSNGTPTETA